MMNDLISLKEKNLIEEDEYNLHSKNINYLIIQAARFLSTDLVGLADVQAQLSSMDILIEQVNSQTSVLYGSLVAAQEALDRGQNVINNQVL